MLFSIWQNGGGLSARQAVNMALCQESPASWWIFRETLQGWAGEEGTSQSPRERRAWLVQRLSRQLWALYSLACTGSCSKPSHGPNPKIFCNLLPHLCSWMEEVSQSVLSRNYHPRHHSPHLHLNKYIIPINSHCNRSYKLRLLPKLSPLLLTVRQWHRQCAGYSHFTEEK